MRGHRLVAHPRRIVRAAGLSALLAACLALPPESGTTGPSGARGAAEAVSGRAPAESPFGQALAAAAEGDADSQNLLGFMLFFGEAAPHDPEAAWYWFEQGAAAGSPSAQVNLALLYELGTVVPRDRQEALRYFRLARDNPNRPVSLPLPNLLSLVRDACAPPTGRGEDELLFGTYCAGCHGRAGIAVYGEAPSFALGERMQQSDEDLLDTIRGGHGLMPEWTEKLPEPIILATLRHARHLQTDFRHGTLHRLRPLPDRAFRFGEMASAPPWFELEPSEVLAGPSFDEACRGR